ncbi:endonuclease/exonuclease/phosphatase [Flaviaesturariibacter flavus]|uniref:Endonuclease/exonuclease/phosphatase n=1 Tax=Flaviaesturariibacter flavus TaxID=2502780 RepID=A0A4R1BAM7_9BACT|nr:endonuclease/exonuclease/phosphatase family protein [Flaviaesturariibacter flavus]TCJ14009.1 endonuclease/exonuclease/phosphatase [Flaviaesturariibacter flavus]
MAGKARLLARRTFLIINGIIVLLFLLSCLAPYLNPQRWWFIAVLGLGFAATLSTLLLFLVFTLIVKPRYALLSVAALLLGFRSIAVFFAFSGGGAQSAGYAPRKGAHSLRVVHWNVARFIEQRRNNNEGSQTRQKMLDQLRKQNADIICFQEFMQATGKEFYDNLGYIRNTLGYKYFYFPRGEGFKNWYGQAIFSRYPLIDTGYLTFPRPGTPEKLLWADVVLGGRNIIRIYTSHLQSYKLEKDDYERIEKIKNREDSLIPNSLSLWSKLKRATAIRAVQADIVRDVLDRCTYPIVFTGDLNDVPNSYAYQTVRGRLQDAFLQKGFGIGRTYNALAPTLRIDYIFTTRDFKVLQFRRIARDLSDHYMLVADLEWKR